MKSIKRHFFYQTIANSECSHFPFVPNQIGFGKRNQTASGLWFSTLTCTHTYRKWAHDQYLGGKARGAYQRETRESLRLIVAMTEPKMLFRFVFSSVFPSLLPYRLMLSFLVWTGNGLLYNFTTKGETYGKQRRQDQIWYYCPKVLK